MHQPGQLLSVYENSDVVLGDHGRVELSRRVLGSIDQRQREAATSLGAGPLRVLAGQDDTRILLVVQGASGAEVWAGVPADVGKASS